MRIRQRIILSIIGFSALVIGLILYIMCNHSTHITALVFSLFPALNSLKPEAGIPIILQCWGADYLWMFAFTLFVQVVIDFRHSKKFFLLLCPLLGVLFELLQHYHLITGTADIGDIFAYLLGSTSALAVVLLQRGGNDL